MEPLISFCGGGFQPQTVDFRPIPMVGVVVGAASIWRIPRLHWKPGMPDTTQNESLSLAVPIAGLPAGEIMPPMSPDDPTWAVMDGWVDPLAPRCGYRTPSGKTAIAGENGAKAIAWENAPDSERCLMTGAQTWRDYTATCRVQALQETCGPCLDGHQITWASAGLVFRMETSRRYYYFGLQQKHRLVLFRRSDDEWAELASRIVDYHDSVITLTVEANGDSLRAACPELGVSFFAVDTQLKSGKVGFRARGECRLFDLQVSMNPAQRRLNQRLAERATGWTAQLGTTLPDEEKIGELTLPANATILEAGNFVAPEANHLLLKTADGLEAVDWSGRTLWHFEEPVGKHKVGAAAMGSSRRIYAMVGERQAIERDSVRGQALRQTLADEIVVLDGATGAVLNREKLPELPDADKVNRFDFSFETGRLTSDSAIDFVVRQWRFDCGDGGRDLWAYDGDLNLLWHHAVDPPYGHHNAVHLVDLNGDGLTEVMAGGTLLSSTGEIISTHDRSREQLEIAGAHHYDAVLAGHFSGDEEQDPIAFLMGGSSGVYVIDPLTGQTRSFHRVGHAQWGMVANLRDDLPGQEIMVGTRWGNYGILSLFSGRGDRLWSIQPDYILQGTCPVQWTADGPQHIWLNTSRAALGLYDGHGRLVKRLDGLRDLWGNRLPGQCRCDVLRRTPDGPDLLAFGIDDTTHLFAPSR